MEHPVPSNKSTNDKILLLIIAIIPLIIILATIQLQGPLWDLTVRYLDGRTLVNSFIYGANLRLSLRGEFSNNLLYYFEPYREPLSTPIFAFLYIFFQKGSIMVYVTIIYIFYLMSLYKLGSELSIDKLVLFSVFANSYILYFLFIPNGGEGLSIIFVLLGLVYLLRKKPISGLFFGIAALAKYPSIITFPLVLFLNDRKKILQAVAFEAIIISIWGVIDYALYGIPFYSYFASIVSAGTASAVSAIYLASVFKVIAYPAIFIAAGVIFLIMKGKLKLTLDYTSKILVSFVALSAFTYLIIVPHNDPITQARYGYLLAVALLLCAALILNSVVSEKKHGSLIKYIIALSVVIALAFVLYRSYSVYSVPPTRYYNPNYNNSIYVHSAKELSKLGFGGCNFISNNWVMMLYYGYNAYSPFTLYTNKTDVRKISKFLTTLSLNNTIFANYSNASLIEGQSRYPILIFKWTGVPASLVINLNQSKMVYTDQNISIYLPKNVSCYRN